MDINIRLKRVTIKEKALFTRAFAAMIGAGLPLVRALTILKQQTNNKYFAGILSDVIRRVEEGENLSGSLSHYPKAFENVYVKSIKAAEASGKLEEILDSLAEQLEKEYKLSSSIKNAVAYPIFIVVMMIIAAIILLLVVVPKLQSAFAEASVKLPLTTRILIGTTNGIINYWYLILLVIIAAVISVRYYLKTENGQLVYGRMLISLPIIRELYVNVYMARFTRTFAMLSSAGVPIMETVKIVGGVVSNKVYEKILAGAARQLERGVALSSPISQAKEFPPLVSQMMAVGEQTGKIDEVMLTLADFFDEEAEKRVGIVTSLLEPILLVIVGVGVGTIVFSIVVPIYQIAQMVR